MDQGIKRRKEIIQWKERAELENRNVRMESKLATTNGKKKLNFADITPAQKNDGRKIRKVWVGRLATVKKD